MAERRYSREEVDAILGRALQHSAQEEGLTHEELVAAAGEVGVAPEAIARAAAEVDQERRVARETQALRRRQVRGFFGHLTSYILVCSLLAAINLMVGGALWFPWVLLGWGFGLAMHLRRVVAPDMDRMERRARSREERRLRREEQRMRDRELKRHAHELGVAVTKGLATVAKAAADRIDEELQPKPQVRVEPPNVRVAGDENQARDVDATEDEHERDSRARRKRST